MCPLSGIREEFFFWITLFKSDLKNKEEKVLPCHSSYKKGPHMYVKCLYVGIQNNMYVFFAMYIAELCHVESSPSNILFFQLKTIMFCACSSLGTCTLFFPSFLSLLKIYLTLSSSPSWAQERQKRERKERERKKMESLNRKKSWTSFIFISSFFYVTAPR